MARAATGKAPKVLIADDDPAILKFLGDRCAKLGLEVHTASNGLTAFIMAHRGVADILIVDVSMPDLDGLSLCFHMLRRGKKAAEVIVMTGSADPAIKERCERYGAIYGRKGPELWNVIRSALGQLFPELVPEHEGATDAYAATPVPERPRVLVVDDDPDVSAFIGTRLRQCGLDVLCAPDGVRGYRMARREMPSVIIADYFMLDGDAHYLLQKLRSNPVTEKIPVFILSGKPLDVTAKANLRRDVQGHAGALHIFRKGFDMNELFMAIQERCAVQYKPA